MTGSRTNGKIPPVKDYDAILAVSCGRIRFGGKDYTIIPMSARAQEVMQQYEGQQTQMYPRTAALCLTPEETAEHMMEQPTAISVDIVKQAMKGINALMQLMEADALEDSEKNGSAASGPSPAPTTQPASA